MAIKNHPLLARWGPPQELDAHATGGRSSEASAASFLERLFRPESSELAALVTHAASLRPGHSCSINRDSVSRGSYHVLLRIEFDDSVVWVARLVLPPSDPHQCREDLINTDSEVATMLYLAQHTSLPVPKVYGYKYDSMNPLGVPYIFLQFIEGETLFWRMKDPRTTDEHRQCIVSQIAQFLGELSGHRFNQIGQLRMSTAGAGQPFIGGMVTRLGMELGPFNTATEYYSTRANLLWQKARSHLGENNFLRIECTTNWAELDKAETAALIAWLHVQAVPTAAVPQLDEGPFLLHHPDLSQSNIIVDQEFKIVGLVDWSWASTVPLQSFTVFPAPASSYFEFCWPSTKGWDCDRKDFIEEYKIHENSAAPVSLYWGLRPATIAAYLDSRFVENVEMAKELAGLIYREDDERKALDCLVKSLCSQELK